MTPSELKYEVESHGHDRFFFTRQTMRFFGDTMRNYGVKSSEIIVTTYTPSGRDTEIVEVWELFRKHPVKHGLKDSAYFDKKTFRRVFKEDY